MCRHPAPDCSPSPNRLLSLLQSLRPTIVLISISYFNIYCNTLLIPFQFLGIAQKYSMIRKMKSKLKLLFAPDIYKTKNYHKLLPPPHLHQIIYIHTCCSAVLLLLLFVLVFTWIFRVFHGFAQFVYTDLSYCYMDMLKLLIAFVKAVICMFCTKKS